MKPKITLDAEASERAIETAIRTQAQTVIELPEDPDLTINGFLMSGDQKAILMEITGKPALNPADLNNTTCLVSVYSDQRYQFESKITATPHWGETRSLALSRPTSIDVLDRRRFVRAKLAPSSRVTIDRSHSGTNQCHTANLLNVSVAGLACRIEDRAAAALEVGDALQVQFQLPGHGRTFSLQASVTNKTPASEDHTILGIQFKHIPNQKISLDTLRKALSEQISTDVEAEALV